LLVPNIFTDSSLLSTLISLRLRTIKAGYRSSASPARHPCCPAALTALSQCRPASLTALSPCCTSALPPFLTATHQPCRPSSMRPQPCHPSHRSTNQGPVTPLGRQSPFTQHLTICHRTRSASVTGTRHNPFRQSVHNQAHSDNDRDRSFKYASRSPAPAN
jgi:hypothetical protein